MIVEVVVVIVVVVVVVVVAAFIYKLQSIYIDELVNN